MAKIDLEERLAKLEALVKSAGLSLPVDPTEQNPDFVAHGSEAHAQLLGLVTVSDEEEAVKMGYIVYTSPSTGKKYRLVDQVTQFMHYPDPGQVARLVLQQRANTFEAGAPKVPDFAPPLWQADE